MMGGPWAARVCPSMGKKDLPMGAHGQCQCLRGGLIKGLFEVH